MLDIKWIISNPDQADKLFAKRGIKPMTKKLIKMSQGRSESITNLEKLLERRNVLSKKIPNIKDKIEKNNLINATYEAMMKAIKILKPGIKLGDIGYEIQSYVEEKGFSVVRDFCGHGISTVFHETPNVLHYGKKNTGIELKPGMTFTIEPMINAGKYDVKLLGDGWTAVTKDKSLSAQFEHTIGITENAYEIFTESVKGYKRPPYN